jgi:S-formylglutathione hydrolase FrmB
MAFFSGTIRSAMLEMDTGLAVVLPYDSPAEPRENPCGVLYLFHGLAQNHSSWARGSRVEQYARERGLAVVMPEVQRGFYCDMAMGLKYFSYIADELPDMCERMFRLSGKRENSFVAGLSMGGYGAVRCALARPDRFSACASFSGVLDLNYVLGHDLARREQGQLKALLGNELIIAPENDNYHLAREAAKLPPEKRPRFLLTCGEQDYLRDVNLEFSAHLSGLGFAPDYREWPGAHDWDFWDASLRMAMEWF